MLYACFKVWQAKKESTCQGTNVHVEHFGTLLGEVPLRRAMRRCCCLRSAEYMSRSVERSFHALPSGECTQTDTWCCCWLVWDRPALAELFLQCSLSCLDEVSSVQHCVHEERRCCHVNPGAVDFCADLCPVFAPSLRELLKFCTATTGILHPLVDMGLRLKAFSCLGSCRVHLRSTVAQAVLHVFCPPLQLGV